MCFNQTEVQQKKKQRLNSVKLFQLISQNKIEGEELVILSQTPINSRRGEGGEEGRIEAAILLSKYSTNTDNNNNKKNKSSCRGSCCSCHLGGKEEIYFKFSLNYKY